MDDNYKKFSIHFSCFGIRDLIKQFSNPVVRVNLTGENYEEQEIYIEDESVFESEKTSLNPTFADIKTFEG